MPELTVTHGLLAVLASRLIGPGSRRAPPMEHPFIPGSGCDGLSVPGSEKEILAQGESFLNVSG